MSQQPCSLLTLIGDRPCPFLQRVPEGHHTVSPHLTVRDGVKMIEFYKRAFGARSSPQPGARRQSLCTPSFRSATRVLLNDEFPQMNAVCPLARGGTSVIIHLYVEDVDSLYSRPSTPVRRS